MAEGAYGYNHRGAIDIVGIFAGTVSTNAGDHEVKIYSETHIDRLAGAVSILQASVSDPANAYSSTYGDLGLINALIDAARYMLEINDEESVETCSLCDGRRTFDGEPCAMCGGLGFLD